MEQFILNLFQEHLSKFIIGFRKEQVNANLLNGKGEITAVELNCSYINEMLRKMTPYLEFESIHVTKVSFHVHSWTNIRHSPIVIDIEHITMVLIEPLNYDADVDRRTRVRQVTFQELIQLMKEGAIAKPRSQAYSLLDRIFDNLVIEVRSISITYQPMGVFKTRRLGPWTPPAIWIQLWAVRWVNVDEYGHEESNDTSSARQHRSHHHHSKKGGTVLVYKKLELEYQISLVVSKPNDTMDSSKTASNSADTKDVNRVDPTSFLPESANKTVIPIISSSLDVNGSGGPRKVYSHPYKRMEMQWTIQRRIRDGEYLAIQIDCLIPMIEIVLIDTSTLSHLVHFLTALQFCFYKDRAFIDPLRPTGISSLPTQEPVVVISNFEDSSNSSSTEGIVVEEHEGSETEPATILDLTLADGLSDSSDDDSGNGDDDDVDSGRVKQTQELMDVSVHSNFPEKEVQAKLESPPSNLASLKSVQQKEALLPNSAMYSSDRPVLVFSNGMILHEKFSLSFSLHQIVIHVSHTRSTDDSFQVTMKGVVAEVMWPPVTKEKGGCIQLSIAHLSIQERFGNRVRSLLVGGQKYYNSGPLEQSPVSCSESDRENVFPIFEDRSVRPDPLEFRQTYPSQAIGCKVLNTLTNRLDRDAKEVTRKDEWMIFPEIGLDQFDIFLDTDAWCRISRFLFMTENGGFDSLWRSGDYLKYITSDMLLRPNYEFIINDYLQPPKQHFLDESYFPSSDVFNANIRIANVYLCIPGSINNDIRSCDISIRFDEIAVKTSSELPRTLANNEMHASRVEFPHDPSDICFTVECLDTADVAVHNGTSPSQHMSTFRSQFKIRGLSIKVAPMIPFSVSHEPEQLLLPTDMTIMFCLEEQTQNFELNNTSMMMLVLTSIVVHHLEVNLDLDLLSAAVATFWLHCGVVRKAASDFKTVYAASRNSLQDRMELIRKRINQSRKDGGLIVSFNLNAIQSRLCLWRQNIPRRPPPRPVLVGSIELLPLLKLCDLRLNEITFNIEGLLDRGGERIVGKLSAIEMDLNLCDFRRCRDSDSFWVDLQDKPTHTTSSSSVNTEMVQFVAFERGNDVRRAIDVRAEYRQDMHCSLALAASLCNGFIDNRVDVVKELVLLLLDAFLVPCHIPLSETSDIDSQRCIFPKGTVGYLFTTIFAALPSVGKPLGLECTAEEHSVASFSMSKLDAKLKSIISKVTTNDLDILLFRVGTANVQVRVSDLSNGSGHFRIKLCDSNVLISYFASEDLDNSSILDVFALKQLKWCTLGLHMSKGFCYGVKSKQSIVYVELGSCPESGEEVQEENIVDEFDFDCTYNNSKFLFDVTDDISIGNALKLERFFEATFRLFRCWIELSPSVSEILKLTVTKRKRSIDGAVGQRAKVKSISLACSSAMESLSFLENLFGVLKERAFTLCATSKSSLLEKDKEIAELRMMVFLKEKERLGTFALFSSEATGWLRLGTAQRSGLRGLMSCMLWQHWVVLRRSLLLVFAAPGLHEIVDFISLEGAKLHEINGGNHKRDLKRAFALVELSGTVHFLIAGSESEFVFWVESIDRAIRLYSYDDTTVSTKVSLGQSSSVQSSQSVLSAPSIDETSKPIRPLGRSLARAVHAAKMKGQAAVGRGVRSSVQLIDSQVADNEAPLNECVSVSSTVVMNESKKTEFVSADGSTTQVVTKASVQQIRNRFASVGQATKSRLGSAISAAKQKGKEVAQLRRQGASGFTSDSLSPLPIISSLAERNESWACVKCTFINPGIDLECQMCNSIRLDDDQNFTNAETSTQFHASTITKQSHHDIALELNSSESNMKDILERGNMDERDTISDCLDDDDTNPDGRSSQIGIKKRLESVVRRARTATFEGHKLGRSSFGTSKPQKLNNISLRGPLQCPPHLFNRTQVQELPLKQLEGTWIVRVEVQSEVPVHEKLHRIPSQVALSDDLPSMAEEVAHQEEYFEGKENVESFEDSGSQPNSDDLNQFFDLTFKIQALKHASGIESSECIDLLRKLSEVAALYISLSESVAKTPSFSFNQGLRKKLEGSLDISTLECMITTGNLLGGLLELPCRAETMGESQRSFYEFVVSEFLNNVVNSPLPIDGLAYVAEFFQLSDSSANNTTRERTPIIGMKSRQNLSPKHELNNIDANAAEFFRVLSLCETEYVNSRQQSELVLRLAEKTQSTFVELSNSSATALVQPFALTMPSRQFRDAMFTALNKVMEERDAAHSKLVSAETLHLVEMDEQRKSLEQLSTNLQAESNTEAAMNETSLKMTTNDNDVTLRRQESNFHRDADSELLSLCQQLAGEISARAAADMEVVRLKECRKIEQELEAAEKRSLQVELNLVREQLQLQNERLELALQDARTWRESFEEVTKFHRGT